MIPSWNLLFSKEESLTENTHHFQNPPGEEAIKFHCHPCSHTTFLQPLENSAPEDILPKRGVLLSALSHQVFMWGRKLSQPHGRGAASQIFAGISHLLKPLYPFLDLDQNPAVPELPSPASQADSITKIPPFSSPERCSPQQETGDNPPQIIHGGRSWGKRAGGSEGRKEGGKKHRRQACHLTS